MGLQQGKKIVNSRMLKKAGIITASLSASIIVVIMMLAIFKNGSNGGFTIKIDNPSKDNHVTMSTSPDGTNSTLLSGQPVKKMYPSTAEKIENYLNSFTLSSICGPQNMLDDNPNRAAESYYSAVVYTVFLTNYSDTEDQKLAYEVHCNYTAAPLNGAVSTIDYMRVMVQTSTSANDIAGGRKTTYFAMHNASNYGTPVSDNDDRECVSAYSQSYDEESNKTVRKTEYIGQSEDGYCVNYLQEENNDVIISQELIIKPKETMRFTFVSYLEGKDPDCKSYAPDSSVLLMSLHFGSKK